MNSWLEKMYEVFDHTPVIDTHSHVMPSNELYDHRQDFLVNFLQQYLQDDIRSAGMTKEEFGYVMDENQDIVKTLCRFAALLETYHEYRICPFCKDHAAVDLWRIRLNGR